MAKKLPKLGIHLNLLKPQSNPEKIFVKLVRWLLSTGRYIFIFVEGVVLLAFISRFKLDADIASKKEAIDQQIPYIESLKSYEVLIRQTQLKLSIINTIKNSSLNFADILKRIANQTPGGVKIISINLQKKDVSQVTIQLNGQSQNNNDLSIFTSGLKQDQNFSDVNISSIGLEKGLINFSINASFKQNAGEVSS